MRHSFLIPGLVLLALAGCVDPTDIEHTTFATSLNIDLSTMTQTPTGLYYKDLVVGNGALVVNGQTLAIHYVGNLPNGTQFDANNPPAMPFTFKLGAGEVIAGFDQGVAGMHVGGRRQMILPPNLGYGAQVVGSIPPNSILVFTVDVVSAQ